MDIDSYFEQESTPAKGSPVGQLMLRVLRKNPGMDFESARQEANALLDKAASKRVYRVPNVYTVEEAAKRKAKMLAAFARSKVMLEAA